MEGKKKNEAADDDDDDDDDDRGVKADIMPSRAAFVPWCVRFWTAVREGKGLVGEGKKQKYIVPLTSASNTSVFS